MHFKRIRDLREDHDYKQGDLAKLLGISQQYYSQYELGHFTFTVNQIIKLANFYKVSTDYILGLSDKKSK